MKPVLQALILADHVYEDQRSRKKIIAGTFNVLVTGELRVEQRKDDNGTTHSLVPGGMRAGCPTAYISMTEVRGESPFVLRYVDLTDNRVLMQCNFKVQCDNPLETVELAIPLPELPTPHAGVYALELLLGDEPMGSLRVTVRRLPEGGTA